MTKKPRSEDYLSDSDRAFLVAASGGTEPPQRNELPKATRRKRAKVDVALDLLRKCATPGHPSYGKAREAIKSLSRDSQ